MKNSISGMVLVFALQCLLVGAAYGEPSRDSKFGEEMSRQEKLYHTDDDKMLDNYVVDRSLASYVLSLSSGFDRALADLGANDRWLDVGAGMGRAILDYYNPNYELKYPEARLKRGKKAQAVAISIEDRRSVVWQLKTASLEANQIRYLAKKRLREYSTEELGQFQLITDVYGGFSYTDNLSRFMEKVLEFLAVEGRFYTLLKDVRTEDGANQPFNKGSPFLTEISNADNSEGKVCAWLKKIGCAEVTCELKQWEPPVEVYRVRKVCNDVTVPALELVHFEAGTPPGRKFQSKK